MMINNKKLKLRSLEIGYWNDLWIFVKSNDKLIETKRLLLIFQERFERISDELRQLGDRMEELKNAATQARDANDVNALHAIGQQMEMIKLRENRLLQEHQHFRPR